MHELLELFFGSFELLGHFVEGLDAAGHFFIHILGVVFNFLFSTLDILGNIFDLANIWDLFNGSENNKKYH